MGDAVAINSVQRFPRTSNYLTSKRWWWGLILRAAVVFVLALTAAIAAHGTATASCAVGYSTDTDRIDAAYENSDVIVTGTVVALDDRSEDDTGGLPLTIATVAVDANYRNTANPHAGTVRVANPGNNSITRTFTLGRRYFVAARSAQGDTTWDTDMARWAPYLDNICTPTIETSALSATFFAALNERLPTQPFNPGELSTLPADSGTQANKDTSTPLLILGAALFVMVFGTWFALWWRRNNTGVRR